ncbi:MAG: hypothetical protein PCFJNLEI_01026 [Verrucomicrobiae bacterium]|nr:hypothetical protein [Verrucomicrobiae bacterium]
MAFDLTTYISTPSLPSLLSYKINEPQLQNCLRESESYMSSVP